jgi:hypothetical protein
MLFVGVSDRRLVNLCLHVWPGWSARKTREFILVRAEYPYVQFELLVFLHWFAVGLQIVKRGNRLPNLLWQSVMRVCECLRVRSPYGGPSLPFYKPRGRGRIHERDKEWTEEGRRDPAALLPFTWAPLTL